MRTGTGTNYDFEITDQHGTSGLALDHTAQTPTWRQFTPYGAPRGATTTWLDDRGFLNKPTDTTTGLTTVGARQYDPATGTFLSLDPVLDDTNPGTLNGYTYTANNPIGQSDPTGLDDWYNDPKQNPCVVECGKPDDVGKNGGNGGGDGSGNTVPVYTHVSPDVSVQGGSKLLHEIGSDWAAEYRKHYRGIPIGKLTVYQDNDIWWDMCEGHAGLCSPDVQTGIRLALTANGPFGTGSPVSLMFSACEFSPSGCGKRFGVGVVAGSRALPLRGSDTRAPDQFAVANYGEGTSGLNLDLFSGCNSFVGQTPVLMADGTTRPIDLVKPGDRIRNALPGAAEGVRDSPHTVNAVHVTRTDRHYVNVTIRIGRSQQTIVGTAHHLYWDATSHSWTPADQLRVGDRLQTYAGRTVVIAALHAYSARKITYNLSVKGVHTYYVVAGSTPILVHNCTVAPTDHYLPSPEEAQKIIQNAPRGSSAAVKSDLYHRAPVFMQDQIAESGTVWRQPQRDPMNPDNPMHVSIPGEVNGKSGIFHWIVDQTGTLVHEAFEPGRR
ncbi:MAG: hypothetical protein QOI36_6382 [Pseudonocardiales bacterium]|nr:hypothetical protein [Pseudonocardiales bacterium]